MGLESPLYPEIDVKTVTSIVKKALKEYKALKVQMENRKELVKNGVSDIFPVLIDSSKANELKVAQIERALETLDHTERQIIEMKYLGNEKRTDLDIYLDLCLRKDVFYKKKKSAIFMIASSLGII